MRIAKNFEAEFTEGYRKTRSRVVLGAVGWSLPSALLYSSFTLTQPGRRRAQIFMAIAMKSAARRHPSPWPRPKPRRFRTAACQLQNRSDTSFAWPRSGRRNLALRACLRTASRCVASTPSCCSILGVWALGGIVQIRPPLHGRISRPSVDQSSSMACIPRSQSSVERSVPDCWRILRPHPT